MDAEDLVRRMELIFGQQARKDVNARFRALVDLQTRLAESQAQTDKKLGDLIAVADRYLERRPKREV
ncbi:MAG TPA: hypothetical protein VGC91_18695 [Pyrinomonadaceae bacterium]